ncbi:hypothetical protein HPB48_018302 [Haemaphysalis longicornis]|uniref:Uncharacterized protein n=1 Tax=Haemaphysalis longicornis TaxID=44386 RepID=A0A9J6FSM4_HAELO|nr:hypothetical protein HPB48_018302 [Haemaphysalis longicornis]
MNAKSDNSFFNLFTELPPSAAQEPPTPTTPGTPITDMSGLLACTPPSFPTPPPSSEATSGGTPAERNSPSLALSGDGETPPPSASLDFDFHLDLDDFEGMDLGMLTDGSSSSKNQASRNQYPESTDLSDPGAEHGDRAVGLAGRYDAADFVRVGHQRTGLFFRGPVRGSVVDRHSGNDAARPPAVNQRVCGHSGPIRPVFGERYGL